MDVTEYSDGRPGTGQDDDLRQRMLTLVNSRTKEEFEWALANKFLVATSPRQRAEWGLDQYEDLPVMSPTEVLQVAFGDGNDPVHERLDPSMEPDDTWDPSDPSVPSPERLAEYAEEERRLDALITIRARTVELQPSEGDDEPAGRDPAAAGADAGAAAAGVSAAQ